MVNEKKPEPKNADPAKVSTPTTSKDSKDPKLNVKPVLDEEDLVCSKMNRPIFIIE